VGYNPAATWRKGITSVYHDSSTFIVLLKLIKCSKDHLLTCVTFGQQIISARGWPVFSASETFQLLSIFVDNFCQNINSREHCSLPAHSEPLKGATKTEKYLNVSDWSAYFPGNESQAPYGNFEHAEYLYIIALVT
jgi:hypothetical protein